MKYTYTPFTVQKTNSSVMSHSGFTKAQDLHMWSF